MNLGLKAVVSFHGALVAPPNHDALPSKIGNGTHILVLHGDLDPHITQKHVKKYLFTVINCKNILLPYYSFNFIGF